MTLHYPLTGPLLMGILSIGALLSILAARRRHRVGQVDAWMPLRRRKRESFTAAGWRYRRYADYCSYLFFAVIVADQLIGRR